LDSIGNPLKRGGSQMRLGHAPPRDLALLATAVLMMLGGALVLVGGWIAAAIATPVITIGIALVVIARWDIHRQQAAQIRGA
jgi:uncharacterized membrane protein YphA (DoxX/SURF4 family)